MSVMASLSLSMIQTVIFVYDFVTYPIYYYAQGPWKKVQDSQRIRAQATIKNDQEIVFNPIFKTTPLLDAFKAAGIDTMDKCFDYALRLHSHKRMLGTRDVLKEEDEVQANGKVFKKWEMGEYRWKSYIEVNDLATLFGKGLRATGLSPKDNICIFAETKAEWLICALGCFKQNFPLVTLYANLGDDAIAYGINLTEVTHIITTHDLLSKFKNVLPKTETVRHIIFIEDQIHQTDRSGYRAGVEIHSFKEVCQMGQEKDYAIVKPTKDDPAIIMFTSGSTGVPKGVILPHEALITTVKAFHFVVNPPIPGDIYLGYLPLAHILELLSEMTMIVQGVPVGYSSPNTMIDKSTKIKKGHKGDCSVLRPSLMCAVPLVIDRIYKGIQENLNSKGIFFKKLMEFFSQYKSYYYQRGMTTPLLDYLIFKKMRDLVGGRIRRMLSGGAPLSSDTHDFVRNALSVPLVQGYGLTETCACATIMDSDELTTGLVGPPLLGVQVSLINWEEGSYRVTDSPRPRGKEF